MFEILMYLFENYMDGSVILNADAHTVVSELEGVGFPANEVNRALDWLDGLQRTQVILQAHSRLTWRALRCYSQEEREKLSIPERGLLLYLEQLGILDPKTREVVIDRLLAFDPSELDVGKVKWVVLLALFNQPEKKAALSLLQDIVLREAHTVLH
ncbi:MAG TPA: DUF494 domain-containing protein [Gammaproteobacteria bacterium]|jgi:Smg protein|nr:DUF494 domain-containing protein [Gammaproteobacteria bacterium]